jgi:hypothetical protein
MARALSVIKNHLGLLFVLFLFNTGCVTFSTIQRMEPHVIVIRNSSYANLKIVTLSEAKGRKNNSVRFGSISPVPIGSDQTIIRPSPPPPLPDTVEISWTDDQNRDYFQNVDLKKYFSINSEEGKKALVFEIQPSGIVKVFSEEYRHSL